MNSYYFVKPYVFCSLSITARFSCVPPVTVVVGGWGKDEDDSLLYPRLSLQEKKTWSDLSSVEVFSPSGRCNNKLRPLPAAVRSIEHSLKK